MDIPTLPLGQLVATASVSSFMESDTSFRSFIFDCVTRHHNNDWGDICHEDKCVNDFSALTDHRVLSMYRCSSEHSQYGDRIFIITEANRSVTTVLWPGEY